MDEAASQPQRGFTVLDGAGLVGGAAAAAVHLRNWGEQPLTTAGWVLAWVAFSGVALSAAGPLILAVRRLTARDRGRLRLGDLLWILLGLPWLWSAPMRPSSALLDQRDGPSRLYVLCLGLPLAVCSLVAMGLVWHFWVRMPESQRVQRPQPTWTERVGLGLAIAWPLQWGFLLIVIG